MGAQLVGHVEFCCDVCGKKAVQDKGYLWNYADGLRRAHFEIIAPENPADEHDLWSWRCKRFPENPGVNDYRTHVLCCSWECTRKYQDAGERMLAEDERARGKLLVGAGI